jgi:fructose-bisphosphate aldolase class I
VAAYTLRMLKRRVPPAVPGIMFLSGGQVRGSCGSLI